MTRAERLMDRGVGVRAVAGLTRGRLDRALAGGAGPDDGPLLAARAAGLTAPRRRAALADTLGEIVRRVDDPPSLARIAPRRAAVRGNADRLRAIAARLREPAPVYARGVAMLELVLRDGSGPLYRDRDGAALADALAAVAAALAGTTGGPDAVLRTRSRRTGRAAR